MYLSSVTKTTSTEEVISCLGGDFKIINFYMFKPSLIKEGWKYYKIVTYNNSLNTNLNDYSILVILDTASLISAGEMRSDCGDIRFTDSDGTTLLNYWIESGCNTPNTKIWVKVPNIPANSIKTIYLYYGNPNAESQSNEIAKPRFNVLSIYPCSQCLVSSFINNYGLNFFTIYCVDVSTFNSQNYDLSKYDAIILDGADCWGGKDIVSDKRSLIANYISNGMGFVATHDTFCLGKTWPELISFAGIDCSGPWIVYSTIYRTRTNSITNFPYALPSSPSIQFTHTTGQHITSAKRWYEATADDSGDDFYLITSTVSKGRVAMIQWGHSTYSCGCEGPSMPPADEQKIIVNTLYWVAEGKRLANVSESIISIPISFNLYFIGNPQSSLGSKYIAYITLKNDTVIKKDIDISPCNLGSECISSPTINIETDSEIKKVEICSKACSYVCSKYIVGY